MDTKYELLEYLSSKHNVLIMGAPGTGKSRLMNEVVEAFLAGSGVSAIPTHVAGAKVPIPALPDGIGADIPLLKRKNRKVFRTTLHQNSKYRDFLTGIVPSFEGEDGYTINEGILYRANEFAKQDDSAALLIIDEINRGPAIEVFGGSIVAIEADKRLSDTGEAQTTTQFFELLSPKTKKMEEYAFSPNLYILTAMNQADVSVAPLDVAFLRRWHSFKLQPNYDVLYDRFRVNKNSDLTVTPTNSGEVYNTAIKALEKINEMISIGRGEEYQLGQGVFLSTNPKDDSLDSSLKFVNEAWSMIYAHIEELFFGDPVATGFIVNADSDKSPYVLQEVYFAEERKIILKNTGIDKNNIYQVYYAIASREL